MVMNRSTLLAIIGVVSASAGLVLYTMMPDRAWLVTLCEGFALVCFAVLLGMEFQRLKSFSSRRSTRMGMHSLLMTALFAGILVIVNFLAARHSVRWDFSENQSYTLSPETHRILRGLPREVSVTVFTREKDPGFQSYRERLDSYKQASNKLTVQFVDPERQPKVAQNYGINRTDTAVFESGNQSVRIMSPSEVEITGALLRVSKDTKKRIVFLEGHGERSIEDKDRGGLSLTKEALGKQGYEVGTLSLLQEASVPDNTQVLIVAGPRRAVTKEEKDRLQAHVAKGGHLMLLMQFGSMGKELTQHNTPTSTTCLRIGGWSWVAAFLSISKTVWHREISHICSCGRLRNMKLPRISRLRFSSHYHAMSSFWRRRARTGITCRSHGRLREAGLKPI